jgi:gamma-glutamyltranspeptidase/glutathione hydrolase
LKADASTPDGFRAPNPGDIFKSTFLARTFRRLASQGKRGFYEGPVADAIVKVVQDLGGRLSLDDLRRHGDTGSEEVDSISIRFNGQDISQTHSQHIDGQVDDRDPSSHGVDVWECPPNGQGIVALMALGILEELERAGKIRKFTESEHNTVDYLHAVIESLRIAFADANWFISDPALPETATPTSRLLDRSYLASRAALFDPNKAISSLDHGSPAHNICDTVYFAVTDSFGNGISFINSLYFGFGSSIIPAGTGFCLQCRGAGFALHPPSHPNIYAPSKRPYHTIIPAMLTNPSDQSLHTVYGVMGGYMQPQGHVQVLLNMLAFKMNPQAALDAPRFCIGAGMREMGKTMDWTVHLEEGISEDVAEELRRKGHKIDIIGGWQRGVFGRGQVIRVHEEPEGRVYSAGSDMRGDGAAYPA